MDLFANLEFLRETKILVSWYITAFGNAHWSCSTYRARKGSNAEDILGWTWFSEIDSWMWSEHFRLLEEWKNKFRIVMINEKKWNTKNGLQLRIFHFIWFIHRYLLRKIYQWYFFRASEHYLVKSKSKYALPASFRVRFFFSLYLLAALAFLCFLR